MKKSTLIIGILSLGLMITSCNSKPETKGEVQVSDIGSKISEEVEKDQEPAEIEEPKKTEAEFVLGEGDFELNTNPKKDYLITIGTKFGEMYAVLYDETPEHKKNFLKLASEGFYDKTVFHRIIKDFMIQGGDPNSRNDDSKKASWGQGGPGYTVPAEFNPKFIHKKGAIAAARTGGPSNPEKRSSGSQFYIVHGKTSTAAELDQMAGQKSQNVRFDAIRTLLSKPEYASQAALVQKYQQERNQAGLDQVIAELTPAANKMIEGKVLVYTNDQKKIYAEQGGAAFLDMDYTVYGEIVKGLDIVDKIATHPKEPGDKPTERLEMTVKVELVKKKSITKKTGYTFK